jgi:hypothetical protein
MTPHSSPHALHEEAPTLAKKVSMEVPLSQERMEYRELAHRQFVPAIKRARDDDDAQETFTSTAANLGKAGLVLSELALRIAELAEKRAA